MAPAVSSLKDIRQWPTVISLTVSLIYILSSAVLFIKRDHLARLLQGQPPSLLWPVQFLDGLTWFFTPVSLGVFYTLCLSLAIASGFLKHPFWCRLSIFILHFIFYSLADSYGKIGHAEHLLIYILAILIFLPTKKNTSYSRSDQISLLMFLNFAQWFIVIPYFFVGFNRVVEYFMAAPDSVVPIDQSFHYWLVNHQIWNNRFTSLSPFLLNSKGQVPLIAFWIGTLFEICCPLLLFFNRQIFIGLGLILFHTLVYLFFGIDFSPSAIVVFCLFVFPYLVQKALRFFPSLKYKFEN